MSGKQKLYFLLDALNDARAIAPSNELLIINPTNDLNRKYSTVELRQLFAKLEHDELILQVIKAPKRETSWLDEHDPYEHADDGCYHIDLLPSFSDYFLKTQSEPEYQEFTGKVPTRYSVPLIRDISDLHPGNTIQSQSKLTEEKGSDTKHNDSDDNKEHSNTSQDAHIPYTHSTNTNASGKSTKKVNTGLWIQNLEAIYQQALTAKPTKPFFLAIYEYVNYILTTDTLAQLSDVFYVHKKADYETAEQYKNELIEYIEALIPKLETYQSDDPSEKDDIREILSIRAGTIQVMGDPEGWLSIFGHIETLSWNAFRQDPINQTILDLLGVEQHDGKRATKWRALEINDAYKAELEKMQRLRETRGWNAWEYLRLFYEMFNDYEGMRSELVKNQRWFEGMNLTHLIEEIKGILKDTTYDQMQVFVYDNYITYLHKAHRQLINEIAQFETMSLAEEPEIKENEIKNHIPFTFNDETTTLDINGKMAKFKKDTRKLALLKLLIKKPKGIYYAEAVDELEGAMTDETMDTKNIYYEACRGIEITLAKAGITDFLSYDYNHAKINPIYKKSV